MSAKRILILTNRVPYPLNDGGNMAMRAMVKGYDNTGWEVYLLSMNTTRHHIDNNKLSEIYQDIYRFETIEVNNTVTPVQLLENLLLSDKPNHADRFYSKAFLGKLMSVISNFKPDVIQTESVFLATYLDSIRNATSAIQVLRMHNIEYQVWSRLASETSNPLKKLYLSNLAQRIKLFEEKVWQKYDLLLPITKYDGVVAQPFNDNIHIAPFGIDITSISNKQVESEWVGYHIGAMDWLPNQEGIKWFLEEVWADIHTTTPEFRLYFAGRNMPDLFKKISIDGVYCEGMVASAEDFIADKKILIVPIKSGGGIRVKILEAMAMGKIVISTSIGMQGIDAESGKHYLLAETPQEFKEAIKWCLSNKAKAESIGVEGRMFVTKHYNFLDIANGLNIELEKMLH